MIRSTFFLMFLMTIVWIGPLAAQDDRDLLRLELASDPVRIHLLPDGRVRIGGREFDESLVGEEAAHGLPGGLVLITSEAGINWRRDTRLRALLVERSPARDVVFVHRGSCDSVERALRIKNRPHDEVGAREIDRLIEELGSDRWLERDGATRSLLALGGSGRRSLEAHRARTDDAEVLWRIDHLLLELGRRAVLEPGFLGIAYHYRSFEVDLAEVGDGVAPIEGGIEIQQVLRGTQAERAGLLDGDRVVEMNRKPISDPLGTGRITQIFAGLRSGHALDLTVWRGAVEIHIEATLGRWDD